MHIPIAEAMRLTVERGLPARPQDAGAAGGAAGDDAGRLELRPHDGAAKAVDDGDQQGPGSGSRLTANAAMADACGACAVARVAASVPCACALRIDIATRRELPAVLPAIQPKPRRRRPSEMPAQLKEVTFKQRLERAAAARRARSRTSAAASVTLGDYFGGKPGRAGVRLPAVPDAVHAGDERHLERAQGAAVHVRARTSTSCSSASIRATRRQWRPRRSGRTWSTGTREATGGRLALPDRRRGRTSGG